MKFPWNGKRKFSLSKQFQQEIIKKTLENSWHIFWCSFSWWRTMHQRKREWKIYTIIFKRRLKSKLLNDYEKEILSCHSWCDKDFLTGELEALSGNSARNFNSDLNFLISKMLERHSRIKMFWSNVSKTFWALISAEPFHTHSHVSIHRVVSFDIIKRHQRKTLTWPPSSRAF